MNSETVNKQRKQKKEEELMVTTRAMGLMMEGKKGNGDSGSYQDEATSHEKGKKKEEDELESTSTQELIRGLIEKIEKQDSELRQLKEEMESLKDQGKKNADLCEEHAREMLALKCKSEKTQEITKELPDKMEKRWNNVKENLGKEIKIIKEEVKAVRDEGDELAKKVKKELEGKDKEEKERDQVIKDLGKEVTKVKERESRVKEEEEGRVKEMKEMRNEIGELKKETKKSWADMVKGDSEVKKTVMDVIKRNFDEDIRGELVHRAMPMMKQEVDRFRSVVITGIEEPTGSTFQEREELEKGNIRKVLKALNMEWASGDIATRLRLGMYSTLATRPRQIKLTFVREETQKEILRRAHNLKSLSEYSYIFIRKDMTKEERNRINSILEEVKTLNEKRTEADKKKFFWKRDGLRGPKRKEI